MITEGFDCLVDYLLWGFFLADIALHGNGGAVCFGLDPGYELVGAFFLLRSLLYVMVTLAPRAARSKAMASPIPLDAPVTIGLEKSMVLAVLRKFRGLKEVLKEDM